MKFFTLAAALPAAAAFLTAPVLAAPVSVEAVLTPQEQMRFDFGDGSKNFVLAVRREGQAEGEGAFAGAKVTEFGWHDIRPPVDGDPRGYLKLETEEGDIAVLRWNVRAVFMKGDGKPALFDNGVWELVRGTGRFEQMRGLGSLVIEPAEGEARRFILDGELRDAP